MSGVIAPLRNNQSELGQQTTNLVDLRGALFGQPTADAMQAQNGLLVISLNGAYSGDRDRSFRGS